MNHKSFDFTQLGGFPLEQERLSWMQQSYTEALQAVSSLIGDNVIVSGCVVAGTNVTDGWVVVGGELLPFKGGVKQNTFSIRNITTSLEFEDSNFKEVQFYKYCEFGTDNPINFDSLTRLKTIKNIADSIQSIDTSIEVLNKQIITGSIFIDMPLDGAKALSVSIAPPAGINPNEYIGYLNFGIIGRVTSSYYTYRAGMIEFYVVRESTNYGQSGEFDYVLIKKQH